MKSLNMCKEASCTKEWRAGYATLTQLIRVRMINDDISL
jgi:hypothetical protein